ncbi:MAG: methylated-DNA--[protein]-cysteine S-methyltransferase [Methanimicrococcus sp.]|nr:methylated-DNA--[protein]-cysteine S-methyltransferase [Methanimicrococcus sp.]
MIYFKETRIGKIGIEEKDGFISKLVFENDIRKISADRTDYDEKTAHPVLFEAFRQLDEYLSGERTAFDLPLAPKGTPFMEKVWAALSEIPYGQTVTYKDIAAAVGNPNASRAVGMANNKNPISIFIPCHRVIGSNGKLTGYAAGTDLKQKLLMLENKERREK